MVILWNLFLLKVFGKYLNMCFEGLNIIAYLGALKNSLNLFLNLGPLPSNHMSSEKFAVHLHLDERFFFFVHN